LSAPAGVLLLQLGTPTSPEPRDVRRFLREFLSDPRVIDLPAPLRFLLVRLVVLPQRARVSAAAYRAIWTPEGSPLLAHSRALAAALARALGPGFAVELGMRYGEPSLAGALARLRAAGAGRILALPLFPQLAEATVGSARASLRAHAAAAGVRAEVLPPFFDDPGFLAAWSEVAREPLARLRPDHVLFSFHGLPERQVRSADPTGAHCLARAGCCEADEAPLARCYRAQCSATARALAAALSLEARAWSLGFQSRLGRGAWIRPYTDECLEALAARGAKRLAVLCPSFVADCVETLEEIGIRGRARWRALGGDELQLVPSLNAHPAWVAALAAMARRAAAAPPS
jgi:ferrochelatase